MASTKRSACLCLLIKGICHHSQPILDFWPIGLWTTKQMTEVAEYTPSVTQWHIEIKLRWNLTREKLSCSRMANVKDMDDTCAAKLSLEDMRSPDVSWGSWQCGLESGGEIGGDTHDPVNAGRTDAGCVYGMVSSLQSGSDHTVLFFFLSWKQSLTM